MGQIGLGVGGGRGLIWAAISGFTLELDVRSVLDTCHSYCSVCVCVAGGGVCETLN